MYDWAVSALQAVVLTAVFPIFFVRVAAAGLPESRGTQALAIANTIAAVIVALISPVLGAVSDYAAAKKRMLAGSMLVGAAATAGMFFIKRGDRDGSIQGGLDGCGADSSTEQRHFPKILTCLQLIDL